MSPLQSQTLQPDLVAQTPPRVTAASLLTYLCAGFVLFLICAPILRTNISSTADFGIYWASGAAAARGANPYAAYPETYISHFRLLGQNRDVVDLNLNPPCVLPLFQVLSHLTIHRFAVAWTVGSSLLLFGTVALLMFHRPEMQKRQIVWLLLAAPVMDTLGGAQLYFGLFLLAALASMFFEKGHEMAAALAIGLLVAIKPTTAFWPLFLYLAGHRKLALRSFGVTLVVSAAPLLRYGPSVYREWFAALANDQHWLFATDIAIPAFFARLGLHPLGFVLALILAALLAWTVLKTKPEFTTVSGLALCATILCAPLAWSDYSLLVAPYFVYRRWNPTSTCAAALLMVPAAVPIIMGSGGRLREMLGSGIYVAAILIILASFASRNFSKSIAVEDPVIA